MEKNYRKIEFGLGDIGSAIKKLESYKEQGELVYGVFNEVKLYSDVDDIDSAYKKITGSTKSKFDEDQIKRSNEYESQQKAHKKSIPKLTKEWIDKGKIILDEKYMNLWIECVPIRLGDLYQGMELGNCLDIVFELNNGCELDLAKDIIVNQNHSGMSFGLVCSMVKSFCNRGEEFDSYVR